jgi:dipeptidyl aminopeptidase/acylaminoacyl peptidase
MHPDGSAAEQITDDEHENSSPHISPDGKSLAFLSRPANAGDSISDAAIRVMGFDDGLIRTLVDFQGNRDSLAMQSWGDRNHLAFISYQKLP